MNKELSKNDRVRIVSRFCRNQKGTVYAIAFNGIIKVRVDGKLGLFDFQQDEIEKSEELPIFPTPSI